MNNFSRRRFLDLGTRTIAGAGLALGVNPALTLARAADSATSQSSDYRALVCVYLEGGCDGFSLMVPTGSYEHAELAQARGELAIPQHQLISLQGGNSPLGLHPNAASLQPLFDDGHLAMIANIGTLIEPTTQEQYLNNTVALPAQLFSHSDQSIQWQQLQGRDRAQEGWGARAADYLSDFQERDYLTSISLAGSNYWQSGSGQRPFSLTGSGVLEYQGLDGNNNWQSPRREAFERVLNLPRDHVFTTAYADLQKRAISITSELGQVLESNASLFTDQPEDNSLAQKLNMVAQLIAAQEQLGLQRQIYYVSMSGFDVHDNQSLELPELFKELTEALAFFQNKIDMLGKSANVTTFTASDFGRSLLSNGDGTDHGWGNHLMAMGGAVMGGSIYGELPSFALDGPDSVHRGRILPTTSASQYASTLLRWVGLDEAAVSEVLPDIGNFQTRDLGFMI
ncbi:DUF1501 domain-containing protein [Granulosicoccus antarcticus]|uniref:Tat pathway signal protein n=1 Tax=Granulosicoccus antarcticus IMCC3135 TaxID=1192854 RepID=A0A2Z2P9C4_9GAMM|nr:DUF1501 domain-containing protein [Granulosicoccus antarcticus]ASJ76494.1 hypothetical protein IMCC3135_32245 [Granulosicoccus antarcticus IMCC3135]